jgi:hypothetical protein
MKNKRWQGSSKNQPAREDYIIDEEIEENEIKEELDRLIN